MAPAHSTLNLSSSPPSGGSNTVHGTPSTMATFMSPPPYSVVDISAEIENLDIGSAGRDNNGSAPLHQRRKMVVPPVNTSRTAQAAFKCRKGPANARLSVNAQVFTPLTSGFPIPTAGNQAGVPGHSPVRELIFGSSPETSQYYTPGPLNVDLTSPQNPGVIGTGPSIAARSGMVFNVGVFTADDPISTRAFIVSGFELKGQEAYGLVGRTYRNFNSLATINAARMADGMFLVEFHDHAEAKQALEMTLALFNFPIECYWLLPREVARANELPIEGVSDHQGEYIVKLIDVGAPLAQVTARAVLELCAKVGLVKAFRTIETTGNAAMSFRVEWSDVRTDVTSLSAAAVSGYRLTIASYTPDIVAISFNGFAPTNRAIDGDVHTRNIMSFLQPTTPGRGQANTPHNVVDVARICSGQDVRTTIMLRNIPNRINHEQLKAFLDETSKGKFDFMYLRIDFSNNCNVGYAFINFVDPMEIVPFTTKRAGKKWNMFQSLKIAEVSYATIQGRDCLIQKFRNSSVMLENEDFRPKLFKIGNGPEAGDEEPFPEADNMAKLKRSCDNAEHVGLYTLHSSGKSRSQSGVKIAPPQNQRAGGRYTEPARNRVAIEASRVFAQLDDEMTGTSSDTLPSPVMSTNFSPSLYAPREGQAYRERQRRQFSQFDRGTSLAQSEVAAVANQSAYAAFNGAPRASRRRPICNGLPVSREQRFLATPTWAEFYGLATARSFL